jgi:hypothetical protein
VRKSRQIRALEERHGKPLAVIVAEAYSEHGSNPTAAAALGVNVNTFAFWKARLTRTERPRAVPLTAAS